MKTNCIGLIGRKLGMTRVYDDKGRIIVVTVIDAKDNVALQRKTMEKDGYNGIQVGFDTQKEHRVTKPELGHFKKHGATQPKKIVKEFRLNHALPVEGEVSLSVNQFEVGDFVDVIGRSKGKGFAGAMKKHNFHGQPAAHGSKMHRRTGAIGCRSTPGRIWKNQGMPGHLGCERKTVQNLVIQQVREAENLILVAGPVPGPTGSYVMIRPAIKKKKPKATKA